MSTKSSLKTLYTVEKKLDAYFTGRQICIAKNGEYLFCQCLDNVSIVKISTGEVIKRISVEDDEITSISLSPDNLSLVVSLKSLSIRHYSFKDDIKEPILLRSFRSYHNGPIRCFCWDSSSTLVASGSSDGTARIWDLTQKFCTHSLKGAVGVFSHLLFPANLLKSPLIYGAAGINIYIWLLEAGASKLKGTLEGHNSNITQIQLCNSEDQIVSCGLDRVIILWDTNQLKPLKIVPILESLSGLVLMPPDVRFMGVEQKETFTYVMVIGEKGVPSIWEVNNGKELWKSSKPIMPVPDSEGVTLVHELNLNASLDSVIFTTYDNSILFFNYNSLKIWKQLTGFNEEILDAAFIGDKDSHLVVASNTKDMRIYNCSTMSCSLIAGHNGLILSLARHPTLCDVFGSSSHDHTARIWVLFEDGSARCIAVATGHTHSVGSLAFGDDFLVTASKDTCIKKWDLSPSFISKARTEKEPLNVMSLSTEKAHSKDINSICVSRNNKFIASGSQDKLAKVFDASMSNVATLSGHKKGVWCCQFSPVDQILATASSDATIKIWTLSNFANAMTLEGHSGGVLRLSFVTSGLQILSSGADGLLKLWTLKGGSCVDSFDNHEGRVWALSVAKDTSATGSDGVSVVTGGEDSTLIWWKDTTEEEKKKKEEEKQLLTSQEQTLLNLIQKKKWGKALRIAIALAQPFRALKVTKELLDENPKQFTKILRTLKEEQLATMLEFAVQWNTKSRDVREAQALLTFLFSEKTPSELEEMTGFAKALEGLLPYTERHYKRADALHQSSYILQYIVQGANLCGQNYEQDIFAYNDETSLLKSVKEMSGLTDVKDEVIEDNEAMSDSDEDMSIGGDKHDPISVDSLYGNFEIEAITASASEKESEEESDEADSFD